MSESLSVSLRLTHSGEERFSLDASFTIAPGVTVLFGPSGAGKTTLLHAISGLIRPAHGRITLGDTLFFDAARKVWMPVHRRRVAMVFQTLALFPHLTALENVAYGIEGRLVAKERLGRARAMLARMKVGDLASRRSNTFSGGEAQRVALARAFAMSPRLMLLDEPFSALDRDLRLELQQDVRSTIETLGIPAILVTHHRREALALGTRLLRIEAGRITAEGAIDELRSDVEECD